GPLLFALLALAQGLTYHQFFDRYTLVLLPAALLLCLVAFPTAARARVLGLAGMAFLAAWSIWWERDYLDRRAALWQSGLALVSRGVPPEEIDGGYEWNGWYRGRAVLAAAVDQALAAGPSTGADPIGLL